MKKCRRPQIAFKSAEPENEPLSDACAPPSGSQGKYQEASNLMLDIDRRAIMVYGIPYGIPPQVAWFTTFQNKGCISAKLWLKMRTCQCAKPIVL